MYSLELIQAEISDPLTFMSVMLARRQLQGDEKRSDKGGKPVKGSIIYFIRSDNRKDENQFDFLMAHKSQGLTQADMTRLTTGAAIPKVK